MISILHPSRGRPGTSFDTIDDWEDMADNIHNFELIVSLDEDDPLLDQYKELYGESEIVVNKNKSAVDAINNAAKVAKGDIMMVVSDDTDCFDGWDTALLKELEGKEDFILKTQDGIQDWIITNPILDRAYYNRTGYIYDPDFKHMFCDTWLTVQADISGRKITSNLMFKHLNDSIKDDVRKRSDATWQEGERTFIQKIKQTPVEDLNKITDRAMKNWIRNKTGIRV
jgi:glycosyl transferase family 2